MGVFITDKDGKLKKVAGNFIPKESPNLGCLRTEVVYDMTSNDASKNWGYASGIRGNVEITEKDFTKYKQLKFYGLRAGIMVFCAEIDISQPVNQASSLFGRATSCFHFVSGDTSYVAGMTVEINPTLTGFTTKFTQNTSDQAGNTDWVVAKIEGVLHEPAMIYTGAELHEGDGISIKDGVISANEKESFLITHPINSLYITEEEESPIDKYGGGWLKIGEGYTLWTASSGAGETISAGLPNISGSVTFSTNGQNGFISGASGAFSASTSVGYTVGTQGAASSSRYKVFNFNASKSSSIYGSSTTVQPPAYKVYIWKRIS